MSLGFSDRGYWERVLAGGLQVPPDRPLPDLTEELTRLLGDPDPRVREGIAVATLTTWLRQGVYDDLLVGLGDGIATGLSAGLGESGTDSVFRRSWSAAVLAQVLERDTSALLLAPDMVLRWGDQLMVWLLREQDLRGVVPGHGLAHAVANGADALRALAASPHVGEAELVVVLDVVADRLLLPTATLLTAGEPDRLASATTALLARDRVDLGVLEPWLDRLGAAGAGEPGDAVAGNVQGYLRALHLQLAIGPVRPAVRADLLLALRDRLIATNPFLAAE